MQSEGLLVPLARFALETPFESIPEDVAAVARDALIDWVSVAMPGADMPVAENVRSFLTLRSSHGPCRLFGTEQTADPVSACLFNGTASHALDFDDVSWATIGHPSVSVAPAVFAASQLRRCGGRDVLAAYVIGIEVMHQIARWTMPGTSERGWHTTPAYGVFGAAAAACRLLGATVEQTVNALAIAASRAGGVRANFGTQTKALHAGLSAANGFEAAQLAMAGVTGSPEAIEKMDGFAQCFCGLDSGTELKADIGSFWDLRENGLVFKQYPCCSGSHPTNDIWNDYIERTGVTYEDVQSIDAGVSLLGPRELNCHRPVNAVQAKFSLEYALACRLVYGPLRIDSFTNEKVLDPRVQELMGRIRMQIDPELARLGFIGTAPVRLRVALKSGEVVRLANDLAEGNPEKPLSAARRRAKFDQCLQAAGCSAELSGQWWRVLERLEDAGADAIAALGYQG